MYFSFVFMVTLSLFTNTAQINNGFISIFQFFSNYFSLDSGRCTF